MHRRENYDALKPKAIKLACIIHDTVTKQLIWIDARCSCQIVAPFVWCDIFQWSRMEQQINCFFIALSILVSELNNNKIETRVEFNLKVNLSKMTINLSLVYSSRMEWKRKKWPMTLRNMNIFSNKSEFYNWTIQGIRYHWH